MSYNGKIDVKFKIGAEVCCWFFFYELPWFIFPVNFSFPIGIWGYHSGQETCDEECSQCHEFYLRRHLHCRNVAENIWHGFCRLFYELMELPWLLHCGGMFFFLEIHNAEMSSLLYSTWRYSGFFFHSLSARVRHTLFSVAPSRAVIYRVPSWSYVRRMTMYLALTFPNL